MENGNRDGPTTDVAIMAVVAVNKLAAATCARPRTGMERAANDALTCRLLRAIALAETVRSNCRAAMTRPQDIDYAEEAAMLARAQELLTGVLGKQRGDPPTSLN